MMQGHARSTYFEVLFWCGTLRPLRHCMSHGRSFVNAWVLSCNRRFASLCALAKPFCCVKIASGDPKFPRNAPWIQKVSFFHTFMSLLVKHCETGFKRPVGLQKRVELAYNWCFSLDQRSSQKLVHYWARTWFAKVSCIPRLFKGWPVIIGWPFIQHGVWPWLWNRIFQATSNTPKQMATWAAFFRKIAAMEV